MSLRRVAKAKTYHLDEGVIATRSAAHVSIRLPRPVSTHHQLRIIAVLWDLVIAARNDMRSKASAWTINVAAFDRLPLSLVAVLSAIDAEFRQAGRKLAVIDNTKTDWFARKRCSSHRLLRPPPQGPSKRRADTTGRRNRLGRN